MAARAERRPRRGPAPIASFDHDVSDESSPENKQLARLPEIREDASCSNVNIVACAGDSLAPPEQRERSHSSPSPVVPAASAALQAPAAPRIDISRASSSSHHDSRDSSPELALFTGGGCGEDARARLELGFREDGALDLRSSTEELAFLEGAPGGPEPRAPVAAPPSRRHSRKDSQGSEAALLGVSGRTSRLSSVGSQCSAHSALSAFSHASRVSHLSARSPSPHKMLLETSFCGPKPIETDPEICAAAVEERLLEIAQMSAEVPPLDARDRREVRTEATVESARPASAPRLTSPAPAAAPPTSAPSSSSLDDDKRSKETRNRAKVEERRARSRDRRESGCEPEVYRKGNQAKDIIRIKLKPDEEYDEDESKRTTEPVRAEAELGAGVLLEVEVGVRKPASLQLRKPDSATQQRPRDSRTPSPSPAGAPVSRKSSFCSLFKSRETIASPDSPSEALRRKKSLTDGRSRSKSRDRSATPTSAGKIKGSVLALFKTPRRSGTSPSPSSRDVSPGVQQHHVPQQARGGKLKYYEEAKNGVIHIPLRTPPDELTPKDEPNERHQNVVVRPISAPAPAPLPAQRTVLPDGSIIIPLHSPSDKTSGRNLPMTTVTVGGEISTPKIIQAPVESYESPKTVTEDATPEPAVTTATADRSRKKERLIFTTNVGSKEQVFSTQFSITKTPSVTSEISESIPSFPDSEEMRPIDLPWVGTNAASRDDPVEIETKGREEGAENDEAEAETEVEVEASRESSGSEASSEAAPSGSDAERRGLVVQESFEELPYVPTTLPMERSLALPMVPVRERGGVCVAPLQRPRAAHPRPAPATLPTPPTAPTPEAARLHIRLPRRPRACSSASAAVGAPPRNERARSRSGSDATGMEAWVDFSELPERRKLPKRIQTLPTTGRDPIAFSYVPPERCRCECHANAVPHSPATPPTPVTPVTPPPTLDLRHDQTETTRH